MDKFGHDEERAHRLGERGKLVDARHKAARAGHDGGGTARLIPFVEAGVGWRKREALAHRSKGRTFNPPAGHVGNDSRRCPP